MKKLTTILLSVMVIALIFALTGCHKGGTFIAKEYLSQGSIIDAIAIDVSDREVTVSISDDNQVHIDYFESEKEYYEITVTKDNALTMTLLSDKTWTDFVGTKPAAEHRKINLKIPNALLANLAITTTNETIKLSPLSFTGNISLSSNGGNIEFEKINVGKELALNAKNGNIKGTIVGSYDIFSIACEIKKGECNLPLKKTDGEKSLKANCNNGNIKIDFVKE